VPFVAPPAALGLAAAVTIMVATVGVDVHTCEPEALEPWITVLRPPAES
jgi:hypothetical protein